MEYGQFLSLVIDDGIEAARQSYNKPQDHLKREGAIKGFEECRGLDPAKLAARLSEARQMTHTKLYHEAADYWYWRCREAEIEWVCNVVSALSALCRNQGWPEIVPCTVRGVIKAAEIIGVSG
jgi:hypothetical protein